MSVLRPQVEPHAVVQVDHVDAGDAAVEVVEVGPDADDPAVELGLLVHALVADVVLARDDVERPDLEGEALRPVGRGRDLDQRAVRLRERAGRSERQQQRA